jgi:hypothetical protein
MLDIILCHLRKVCHFISYYAECHNADFQYAECRYALCHYAECRGALTKTLNIFSRFLDKKRVPIYHFSVALYKVKTVIRKSEDLGRPLLVYGTARFKKCKQLFGYQHLPLLGDIWWSKLFSRFKCCSFLKH